MEKHCYLMSFTHQFFLKNKKIDPYEKDLPFSYSVLLSETKKIINYIVFPIIQRLTRPSKNIVLLYAQDLHFLITRAGWLVTHIYEHYTFEHQS